MTAATRGNCKMTWPTSHPSTSKICHQGRPASTRGFAHALPRSRWPSNSQPSCLMAMLCLVIINVINCCISSFSISQSSEREKKAGIPKSLLQVTMFNDCIWFLSDIRTFLGEHVVPGSWDSQRTWVSRRHHHELLY